MTLFDILIYINKEIMNLLIREQFLTSPSFFLNPCVENYSLLERVEEGALK